jgi:hypothetical protein
VPHRPELVEDAHGQLGVAPGGGVLAARQEDLGAVDERDPAQVHVADRLGHAQELPVVRVGRVPELAVGADHPEVVVGERAAALVAGRLERL